MSKTSKRTVIIRGAPFSEWALGAHHAALALEGHMFGAHIPEKKNARESITRSNRWLVWMEGDAIIVDWRGRRLCTMRDCPNQVREETRNGNITHQCTACNKLIRDGLPQWFDEEGGTIK